MNPEPITMRRLAELGIPDTTLDALKKQAVDGQHFIRNPEAHGRIEWTDSGVDWLLAHGDLAPLADALRLALKKTAAPAPSPNPVIRAVRRAQNAVLVLGHLQGSPANAPLVKVRVPVSTPISLGMLLPGRLVPGFRDLYELAGKPTRARN